MRYGNFFTFIGLIFATCALCSCSDDLESSDGDDSAVSMPDDAVSRLDTKAEEFFKDSPKIAQEWKRQQAEAYEQIKSTLPNVPAQVYVGILSLAESTYPEDFKAQKNYIDRQVDDYNKLKELKQKAPEEEMEFIGKYIADYGSNFNEELKSLKLWQRTYKYFVTQKRDYSGEDFDKMLNTACEDSAGDANEALRIFKQEVKSFQELKNVKADKILNSEELVSLREFCEKRYPQSYRKQMTELNYVMTKMRGDPTMSLSAVLKVRGEGVSEQELRVPQTDYEKKLAEISEDLFRSRIFTKRGKENDIFSAELVLYKGRPVVLCSKEFFNSFPLKIVNSKGEINCSTAFVSKDFPVIMLVPDELPKAFSPMELVENEDADKIFNRPLFAIGPKDSGISSSIVEAFSEDQKYLNLRTGYAPNVYQTSSMRVANRSGTRFMQSTTEFIPFGENSVIIDPENGKLVSIGIRVYNPGIFDEGKTGSIIGHERAEIPDFNTFVRNFDAAAKIDKPFSSIRYIRIPAMDKWEKFDSVKLEEQKTVLRKFTDSNNDFLLFFSQNSYQETLKSRRLGLIAERFKKELLYTRMNKDSYDRTYRRYMLDVLHAMSREMKQYTTADSFYSIYKAEMEYQISLRQSMFKFLSETVKDDDMSNAIHVDLRLRYNDPLTIIPGKL